MTIDRERTNALLIARSFLRDLGDPMVTPRVPLKYRRDALRILKHYPSNLDLWGRLQWRKK